MGYKVKKIYVGTTKVRPGYTSYTIAQYSQSDTGTNISIAKSGATVNQVVIEGSIAYNSSNGGYGWCGGYIGICDSSSYGKLFRIIIETGNGNGGLNQGRKLNFRISGTGTDIYNIPSTSLNLYGTNTFTFTITRTGWTLIINGDTYSGPFTSTQQGYINDIMNSSTIVGYTWSTHYSINNQTYNVYYN